MSGRHARRLCCREASQAERLCCCVALSAGTASSLRLSQERSSWRRLREEREFETSLLSPSGAFLQRRVKNMGASTHDTRPPLTSPTSSSPTVHAPLCCPPHPTVCGLTPRACVASYTNDERPPRTHTQTLHTRNSTQRKYTTTPHDPGAYKTPSSFPPCLRSLLSLVRARSCM